MKKVLLITYGNIELGGVQNFLINWIIESEQKYSYVWYCCGDLLDKKMYEQIRDLDVEIIVGKRKNLGVKKFYYYSRDIHRILKEYDIDIVHINTGALSWSFLGVFEAKRRKISKIISHSHSAIKQQGSWQKIIAELLKQYISKTADICAACSEEAAISLFGKKTVEENSWVFVKNRIDVEKYKYNSSVRVKIRNELRIKDEILLGNVGQLYPVKNQMFLLEIMKILKEDNCNIKLLIIGTGLMKDKLDRKVKEYQLEEKVILLGEKKNVNEWLQAMDIFLMPSLHEGLSIAAVEAQTAGLSAIFNECFSKEIKLTDNVEFLPIDNPGKWADMVKKLYVKQNEEYRKECKNRVIDADFDIGSLKSVIIDMYK